MASKSPLAIRAAVMNCLARCAESQTPLYNLGNFLEKLSVMGWSSTDIRSVEMTVLRVLGHLREKSLDQCDCGVEVERS